MTRIERSSDVATKEDLKHLEKTFKKNKKGKSNFKNTCACSCCLGSGFTLILVIVFVLIIISKFGFWKIPVISDIFYTKPLPRREIVIKESVDEYLKKIEESVVNDLLSSKESINLNLTEEYITVLLLNENKEFSFDTFSFSVNKDDIEIYILSSSISKAPIILRLKPLFKDENFSIQLTKMQLGEINIPSFLVTYLSDLMLGKMFDSFKDKLIYIKEFELSQGSIDISIDKTVFKK